MTAADSPLARSGSGGLAVRLVRAADGLPGPFAVLAETAGARVHLAELHAPDGRVVARCHGKLRRDDEPGRLAGGPRTPTNGEVDAAWARDRAEHERVHDPHVVAAVGVPAGMLASAPVFWCQRVDRCFHPVSPATGLRLRTCRDDALLARSGLPPYAHDVVRYLHDGSAATPATFYRQGRDTAGVTLASGAQVRGASRLLRDYAALVHAAPGDAVAAAAASDLICLGCEHRLRCYPTAGGDGPVPAERELHAVSFHDVDAVALEAHDLDFDDANVLLGGGGVDDLPAARAALLAPATRDALRGARQWLFAGDAPRFVLEVLRQKLALFLDVCTGVAAVHAAGRPHLALAPHHVAVAWRGGGGAPARWQLRASVGALGSAQPIAVAGANAGCEPARGPLLEPGGELRDDARARVWLGPDLVDGEPPATLLPVACWRTGSPDGLVRFAVEATGDGVPRRVRAGDLVAVQPETGGATLVACVDGVPPRGLLATALLPPEHPCLQWDGQQFAARLRFHHRLGPAADLPALGLLLLRAVCVDDAQPIELVAGAIEAVVRRLEQEPTAVHADDHAAPARLRQLLQSPDVRGRFDPVHLLHRERDRESLLRALPANAPVVAPALWERVLAVAAKAIATCSPFGFAARAARAALVGLGGTPVQLLVADVQRLLRRLDAELFHADACSAAIAAAAEQTAERRRVETARATAAAPAPERGFRIELRHDGDVAVQELRYQIDRVTIGRREGQNLLRLNDPMVSSLHAVIQATPDGWAVSDRNSTNGTEVDGIRLPVEVPQPLRDGSVIVIRPFRLLFRELDQHEPAGDGDAIAAQLQDRLRETFANELGAPHLQVHEALLGALEAARGELPPDAMLALLDELARQRPGCAASATDAGTPAVRALHAAAARALAQLSRTLLGPEELATPEQVQLFAGKIGRFVDATSHWIERLLELRKALGKHLDLGLATTASGRAPVRTAAEVRALVVGWHGAAGPAEPSAWYVAKFYDDLIAVLVGLLRGNQQVRRALRERLDPARLVDAAGRETRLRASVHAAAASSLWRLYVETFTEVTGSDDGDPELDQLLRRVEPERGQPA